MSALGVETKHWNVNYVQLYFQSALSQMLYFSKHVTYSIWGWRERERRNAKTNIIVWQSELNFQSFFLCVCLAAKNLSYLPQI